MTPEPPAARLLAQLETFSARFFGAESMPPVQVGNATCTVSPHGIGHRLHPAGLVLHYTANETLAGTCRWFCDSRSRTSAHFVVGKARHPAHDALSEDLPDVRALPATVVQMRPLDEQAWHATWANRWALGIEMVNLGEMRQDATGQWHPVAGSPGYQVDGRHMVAVGARRFLGFTEVQLQSALALCRALVQHLSLPVSAMLGHDMVQGAKTQVEGAGGHDKRDVGGICLDAWRQACLGDVSAIPARLNEAFERTVPTEVLKEAQFPDVLEKQRFAALGYFANTATPLWTPPELDGLRVFQVMMGLKADQICGPQTRAALAWRCADRFGPPPTLQPEEVRRVVGRQA